MTDRAEDIAKRVPEPGRDDTGTQGPSERPVGTSTARDSTSIDPQDSITGGPTQPAGDQAG